MEFKDQPEVTRFAIYKIIMGFVTRLTAASKPKDIKDRQSGLVDWQVNIFDRLHFSLPQLYLKESILGFIAGRNMLFYPKNAQMSDTNNNNEFELITLRGFRLGHGNKREGVTSTISRL